MISVGEIREILTETLGSQIPYKNVCSPRKCFDQLRFL